MPAAFRRLEDLLFSFALKLTSNREDAKDIFQETLLRAYSNKHRFALGTNFKAWITTILRNCFINKYRKQRTRNKVEQPLNQNMEFAVKKAVKNDGPSQLMLAELDELFDRLDIVHRLPFELFYEGHEYREIADLLDLPIGTVSSLSAKRAAGSDAQNVVGVVLVKNNLKVRPANVPADSTLRSRVEEALHRIAEVDHLAVNVAARNGKIFLNGLVDTYYELYRAEATAANVKGVKEVLNNIGVSYSTDYGYYYPNGIFDHYYPSPFTRPGSYYSYPLSDAQIKENIEDELWWSPFVNESDVTVTVLGKVATLTGTIDSWRERNAAIENAYEGGAYSVIDKLAIDYGTSN